jgi:predicted metalloenzyme YecM
MKDIIGDYEPFIENISAGLAAAGIDRQELALMDHICYRVETHERYKELLHVLSDAAIFLSESLVSGRNIAVFELHDYIRVDGWVVPYLELPAPKPDYFFAEGLEHAELVVVGGLERFRTRHTDLSFDDKSMDKQLNPELAYRTPTMAVKFHEQPLGAVVRIEQRLAGLL